MEGEQHYEQARVSPSPPPLKVSVPVAPGPDVSRTQGSHTPNVEKQRADTPFVLDSCIHYALPVDVPTLKMDEDGNEVKPSLPDMSDPWEDVTSLQPEAKKEEPLDSTQADIVADGHGTLPQARLILLKVEVKEELKPELSETADPWDDVAVVQSTTKKEESPDSTLSSSSNREPGSPMLHGLKRARSDSSLLSLPSDIEVGLKELSAQRAARKRLRSSRDVGFARRLSSVSFAAGRRNKSGSTHQSPNAEIHYRLRAVTFQAASASDLDEDMPLVEHREQTAPFWGHDPLPAFADEQDPPPRSATPENRIKPEPMDVGDNVILNAIDRNSMATNVRLRAKKEVEIDEMTVQKRLIRMKATIPYEIKGIPKPLMNVLFSRACLSWYFGGSPQSVYPKPNKENFERPGRGIDNFQFVPLHMHPNAPKIPGHHGVMHWDVIGTYREPDKIKAGFMKKFKNHIDLQKAKKLVTHASYMASAASEQDHKVYTTLVGGSKGGFAGENGRSWLYIGQCITVMIDILTTIEWNMQDSKVHSAWARELTKANPGWGEDVCFRVKYRRKYKRDPTEEEARSWKYLVKRRKINAKADWTPEPEDIKDDFAAGKERLSVEVLKCVGYDSSFIRRAAIVMEDYIRNPPPPPPKSKKSKKAQKADVFDSEEEEFRDS